MKDAAYQKATEEVQKQDTEESSPTPAKSKTTKVDATRTDLGKAKESLEKAKRDRDVEMREREAAITAAELGVRHKGKAVLGSEAELSGEDEEISSNSENLKHSRKVREENRKSEILKDDLILPRRDWLLYEPKARGSATAPAQARRQQPEATSAAPESTTSTLQFDAAWLKQLCDMKKAHPELSDKSLVFFMNAMNKAPNQPERSRTPSDSSNDPGEKNRRGRSEIRGSLFCEGAKSQRHHETGKGSRDSSRGSRGSKGKGCLLYTSPSPRD